VQPALRKALGRNGVWGIGLPMAAASVDTENGIWQFIHAYEGKYVTRDGRLVIDDPEVRRRLIQAVGRYTQIYRKGCTPPDSVTWEPYSNNEQFLAQAIVMTPNQTLSITNALKTTRPSDYYDNALTIDWPAGAYGQPLAIALPMGIGPGSFPPVPDPTPWYGSGINEEMSDRMLRQLLSEAVALAFSNRHIWAISIANVGSGRRLP
jgi:hypothetical protein